jgi:Zn-dependent protease with chaperone function
VDFFREQDIARRNTRLLTLLFGIAVLVLIGLTNLLLVGFVVFESGGGQSSLSTDVLDWQSFISVGAVITLIIGAVVLVNWINFARGGKQIAAALGGRLVQPSTDDPLEQRAANIVQEMALAANMPVPSLFVLDEETGINAFAAGTSPANAVVAVTQGALTSLNRDQLQGVIGHEFSHILNGDMRLSIRLAAMLRGITFIGDVGSILLHSASHRRRYRSSKKDDGRGAVLAIGLGLYLIGLLGGLMAGLIKSAISKQKEYLADASAVQFTRNPEGIGDALKIIGGHSAGTFVETARAEEMSHLFFGQVRHRLWSAFATHPPIEERIERIDPQWDGQFITVTAPQSASTEEAEYDPGHLAAVAAVGATLAVAGSAQPLATGAATGWDEDALLVQETKDSLGAMALVLGMVWDPQHEQTQWPALSEVNIKGLRRDHAALVQNPAGTLRRAAASPSRALPTHVTGHLGTAVSNFSRTATDLDQRRRQNRFVRVVPFSNGPSYPRRSASGYAPCSTATQKFDRGYQRAGHRAGHAGPPNRRKYGTCFRQRSKPTRATVNPA